ncbi:MAG: sulfite exporter TauE/SafE family protein [Spirochaetaceae bacterium]|nr:sulfite exporter TauE/SafE family protein [Spirochaetaceae bacterium]
MEIPLFIKYLLVFTAGTAAGFFNVVAGGGSLITVPTMIFLGLPPAMANGTNRIAILSQNITAVSRFKKKGYFSLKAGLILGVTASAGALLGARIAVDLPGEVFNRILSAVMILVLILTLFGKRKDTSPKPGNRKDVIENIPLLAIAFFFVGIYGGFIQAGVGFIIIAVFSLLSGTTLVRTNSMKVFIVMIYTIPSLLVFILNGQVQWSTGIVLAVGNSLGAWIGTNFTVSKGDRWIRIILSLTISAMAVKLFFF